LSTKPADVLCQQIDDKNKAKSAHIGNLTATETEQELQILLNFCHQSAGTACQ